MTPIFIITTDKETILSQQRYSRLQVTKERKKSLNQCNRRMFINVWQPLLFPQEIYYESENCAAETAQFFQFSFSDPYYRNTDTKFLENIPRFNTYWVKH